MSENEKRPCEYLQIGDIFGWDTIAGIRLEGIVTDIDGNIVFIRDGNNREWAYES